MPKRRCMTSLGCFRHSPSHFLVVVMGYAIQVVDETGVGCRKTSIMS